jgi:hypothetical protein
MQFMSVVQLAKMFEDAQEHGKRRSRGRVNMDQVNKNRKVPDEQLQGWVKIADRLRVEKGWSDWKASGYIAQTQDDKVWQRRTIYNHLLKYKNSTSRVS